MSDPPPTIRDAAPLHRHLPDHPRRPGARRLLRARPRRGGGGRGALRPGDGPRSRPVLLLHRGHGVDGPGSAATAASGSFTVEFRVTDVDARHERPAAQGVEILEPPTTQPWGRRSVWLRAPDGDIVNLYQEV
ncbi:VOC family protein [Streptomyces sp. NPDC088921]|uniref:VOC family protein n=1 Tax=unclassified Streptomyces TaxID=2593676 RepID=UPI0034180AE9